MSVFSRGVDRTQSSVDMVVRDPLLAVTPSRPGGDDVFSALFFAAVVGGVQPFVARRVVGNGRRIRELVPDRLTIVAESSDASGDGVVIAEDANATILLRSLPTGASVQVSANTMAEAEKLSDEIAELVPPEIKPPDTVRIATWYSGRNGLVADRRRIDAPRWDEIQGNYPLRVRIALAELFALERPVNRGKLMLWHGEAGTGKTTAIRALIREWEAWCDAHYIADPEQLFSDTGYLTEVISPRSMFRESNSGDKSWRLIVAEDSDEFLKTSARRESGAALARLLNVSDGILGQGSDVIILLTTNESLDRLHPALTRPGRCLAEVEFGRFGASEATHWLGDPDSLVGPATLAELMEHRSGDARIISVRDELNAVGQYL